MDGSCVGAHGSAVRHGECCHTYSVVASCVKCGSATRSICTACLRKRAEQQTGVCLLRTPGML
eukprot:5135243-Prorocentrum_lima.AAC.1